MSTYDVGNCPVRLVSKRFVHRAPVFAVLFSILGLGYSSYAWVSLQAGSLPFYWANPTVTYVIHRDADPTITDGSDVTAVRLGFQAWQNVSSSRVSFLEDISSVSRSRTDWRSDDVHMVIWDTNNESGFFGYGTGLVAITPVDFNPTTGEIIDADILFNGQKQFTTSGEGGKFDIQNVATHEIGHLIGLDHSAVVGSTMNPFAITGDTRLRTLERDDIAGASSIYPSGIEPGAIQGYVTRKDAEGKDQPVSGAHVVAEDFNGVPASATLSDGTGFFKIRGLDQGTYVVYAEPLDGPVTNSNFSLHTSLLTIDTQFGTTFYGLKGGQSSPLSPDRVSVVYGSTTDIGTIRALPRTSMNITAISTQSVRPNSETRLYVSGHQLNLADSVVIPGPAGDGLVATPVLPFGSSTVGIDLAVSPATVPQLRSIRLFHAGTWACTVLTGGFEIRMPPPLIEALSATSGEPGSAVTMYGQDFQAGARVVFGAEVLIASGSGTQVSFTVPQTAPGVYSVAVENPDGQFAKVVGAYTVTGEDTTTTTTTTTGGDAEAPPPVPGAAVSVNPVSSAPSSGSGGGGGGGGGCSLRGGPSVPGSSGLLLLGLVAALAGLRRRS